MGTERRAAVVVLCLLLTCLLHEFYVAGAQHLRAVTTPTAVRRCNSTCPACESPQQGNLSSRPSQERRADGGNENTTAPIVTESPPRSAEPVAASPPLSSVPGAPRPTDAKPSIALMSLLDQLDGVYSWMWPMSYHTKAVYCERMGYDLIVGSAADVEPQRPAHWAKLTMLLRWLPYYDYIMWMDADTLVTRFNFAIDSLVVPGIDVVMARDWNNINSGVFLMRNSSFSIRFIKACLAVPMSSLAVPVWQEQAAMIDVLERQPEYLTHFYIPPQRMLNSYPGDHHDAARWRPGDFVAHTPACRLREAECRTAFNETYQAVARAWQLPPIPSAVPTSAYPKEVPKLPPVYSGPSYAELSRAALGLGVLSAFSPLLLTLAPALPCLLLCFLWRRPAKGAAL